MSANSVCFWMNFSCPKSGECITHPLTGEGKCVGAHKCTPELNYEVKLTSYRGLATRVTHGRNSLGWKAIVDEWRYGYNMEGENMYMLPSEFAMDGELGDLFW